MVRAKQINKTLRKVTPTRKQTNMATRKWKRKRKRSKAMLKMKLRRYRKPKLLCRARSLRLLFLSLLLP